MHFQPLRINISRIKALNSERKKLLRPLTAVLLSIAFVVTLPSCTPGASPTPPATSPIASPSPAPPTTPPITLPPTASPTPSIAATTPASTPTPTGVSLPAGFVAENAVNSQNVTFPGAAGNITAYQAWPKTGSIFPAIIVIHENRGLTGHIRDVTRRFAGQGYLALGVDLLSRVGGRESFATDEAATAAINQLSAEGVMQDLASAATFLKGLPSVDDAHIGVIGYCWGGGNSLLFATRSRDMKAAIVYYGPNPSNIGDVANITAPVLGIYGEDDTRITVNVPNLDAAMKQYNKSFEYRVYPGAAHAFFNDTGARYNQAASADAWQRTVDFLKKNLY